MKCTDWLKILVLLEVILQLANGPELTALQWTDEMIESVKAEGAKLFENITSILGSTMCHEKSSFRTLMPEKQIWNASDIIQIEAWEFKMIYLSIYDMLHRPVLGAGGKPLGQFGNPTPQYECHQAKYLVSTVLGLGLGATLRAYAVPQFFLALSMGRIPYLTHAPVWHHIKQVPWQFAPTTHCGMTNLTKDIYMLNKTQLPSVQNDFTLPNDVHEIQAVKADYGFDIRDDIEQNTRGIMTRVTRKVSERASWLVQELVQTVTDPSFVQVLEQALAKLNHTPPAMNYEKQGQEEYSFIFNKFHHAVSLYLMQPSPSVKTKLAQRLETIMPSADTTTGKILVGLPIRGSDKCIRESTCLKFETYMALANETFATYPNQRPYLIVTSEASSIMNEIDSYNSSASFDFIVNRNDVSQNSGKPRRFAGSSEDVWFNSLLAIQMQLHATLLFGNCCSNFHMLLFDFAREGCGLSTDQTCLQDLENREYNMCCVWTMTRECQEHRKQYFSQK